MIVNSPLSISIGKKKKKQFYLNLNIYRNTHFQTLNKVKILYKELIKDELYKCLGEHKLTRIRVDYTYFPRNKRLIDLGNVCSIHQKFFEDALVELGYIPDDNYTCIVNSSQWFGKVDLANPRMEITITEIPDDHTIKPS